MEFKCLRGVDLSEVYSVTGLYILYGWCHVVAIESRKLRMVQLLGRTGRRDLRSFSVLA